MNKFAYLLIISSLFASQISARPTISHRVHHIHHYAPPYKTKLKGKKEAANVNYGVEISKAVMIALPFTLRLIAGDWVVQYYPVAMAGLIVATVGYVAYEWSKKLAWLVPMC